MTTNDHNLVEEQLDSILSQAFTDGASDTMWQNDRHIEIFQTAKAKLQALITLAIKEAARDSLQDWYDELQSDLAQNHNEIRLRLMRQIESRVVKLSKELEGKL